MEILLHCVASVPVQFRCKERGKRVKDRAKNGASMEDRGTGFSVLAAREMKRGPFFARSLTLVPYSLLLNCTKRLLRRLGFRLQNSPYFCVFKYARAVKQKVWNGCGTRLKTESETGERRYGRVRLARFARIRLLRHALPSSWGWTLGRNLFV